MGFPYSRKANQSDTYLRDVIAEVLANNGVRPTGQLVEDLLEMTIWLRAEVRTDREHIRQWMEETLREIGYIHN